MVVESSLDEIPLTSGFDSQMPKVEDAKSLVSCVVVVNDLDETLSILGVDIEMFHLPMVEVSLFHVIFDLNKVLITTCFDRGSHTIILCPGLKEFVDKCFVQFQVYIWSTIQCHNIYNYLNQI
jgi:hypothetical protein